MTIWWILKNMFTIYLRLKILLFMTNIDRNIGSQEKRLSPKIGKNAKNSPKTTKNGENAENSQKHRKRRKTPKIEKHRNSPKRRK
jgi:hypothetical protein